jgi:hypothetical protein
MTASGLYYYAFEHVGKGEFVWTAAGGSTVKCELSNTSPTQTHAHETDLANELAAGSGYTKDGGSVTLIDAAYGAGYVVMDAADTKWTTFSAGPCEWAEVYKYLGAPTTDPLFSFHDFGGAKTGGGGDFTVVWDTNGVARITVTAAA